VREEEIMKGKGKQDGYEEWQEGRETKSGRTKGRRKNLEGRET
jgi:hypothetical protein